MNQMLGGLAAVFAIGFGLLMLMGFLFSIPETRARLRSRSLPNPRPPRLPNPPSPSRVTCTYLIDGKDAFRILYEHQREGIWKLHSLERPPIPPGLSRKVEHCHVWPDNSICVTAGKEPRSLDEAKAIGMFFCKGYSTYCRTGRFPNGKAKVNV